MRSKKKNLEDNTSIAAQILKFLGQERIENSIVSSTILQIKRGHKHQIKYKLNHPGGTYYITLLLWDINEKKNGQSFQCGFPYLDSLSNALTRILNSKDRFRICLLNSRANSAQVWWKWAGLAMLFSRQTLKRSLEFEILVRALDKLSKQENLH